MSSIQWMKVLLILGLLSYSYGYQRRDDHARRRARQSSLKNTAQQTISVLMGDEAQLREKSMQAVAKDEQIIRTIIQNIYTAAKNIADVGSPDVTSVAQWTSMQGNIRKGINIIIDAYRSYIILHRNTCDILGMFANSIITKYEAEISALDQLTPPTLPSGGINIGNSFYANFTAKLLNMLRYAQFHQATLPIAHDSVADLTKRSIQQQAETMGTVTHTFIVNLPPTTSSDSTTARSVSVNCGAIAAFNGYVSCPNSILDQARNLLYNACPNQCYQQ